ncbi:hypothetical protein B0H10DRAFT_544872 [Mycena sp. CBHHK59/15]|nr:hypothetical protein B0H10DRAFT_544872 [Mycena sp. CBHHK59/15]
MSRASASTGVGLLCLVLPAGQPLFLRQAALVLVMISCSQECPLAIRMDAGHHYRWSAVACLMKNRSERIGVIDIRTYQHILSYLFFRTGLDSRSAPQLHFVTVCNTSPYLGNIGNFSGGQWLEEHIFRMSEGRARRCEVRLESCAFPWTSPWYSNLSLLDFGG